MKKEQIVEILFIFFFTALMLWIGLADSWGHKIQHQFPYSYLASDTFQHQTRAQWIKDAGNYNYEAPYYSAGHKDVVGYYPPILNHAAAMFSYVSGLEVYDAILFLTVSFAIIGALIFYLIVRQWNKNIAILSLPFMTQLFTIKEARVAFFWGHWPALLGDLFLVATCWMLINLNKKKSGLFLGIFLAGTVLGHTSATIFAVLFIILFFLVSLLFKKFSVHHCKNLVIGTFIAIIPTAYFLILFKQTWMVVFPFSFTNIWTDWTGGGGFIQLNQFSNLSLTVMFAGLITLLLAKKQENFFQTLLGIFALGAGFTNYIGFYVRAFNFRFYWPIFLSIFFGTGVYTIWRFLLPKNTRLTLIVLCSLLLTGAFVHYNYTKTGPIEGLMNAYTWQTLNWIKDNTPENAKIFFFYGDPYDQDGSLGNTHRRNTRVEITDLGKTIEKRRIERYYPTKELIEGGTKLPYKTGFLSYKLHLVENTSDDARQNRDLCSFDYYVIDKAGRYQILAQLNQLIANTLLENNTSIVFQNELSAVLKNSRPGGKCFGANNTITF